MTANCVRVCGCVCVIRHRVTLHRLFFDFTVTVEVSQVQADALILCVLVLLPVIAATFTLFSDT